MASPPPAFPPGFEPPGQNLLIAHASLMCVVFVLFLPIAALTTRSPLNARVTRVHAPWQLLNVVIVIIGMSLGISVAKKRHIPMGSTPHVVLGFVIVGCLIVLQPALGIVQHLYFRKHGRRGLFGWTHILLGRILLILGLVNGARGFKLARDNKDAPYYAILGVICLVYVGVLLWDWFGPKYLRDKQQRHGTSGRNNSNSANGDEVEMRTPPEDRTK
ncbi:uncharacterized protein Z518_07233 [Rhinocladiella mackenziei CBS 650.93]|uniref:Cytochrome b561 domain-containing protein n=1 Tax=Rhinocladiella mackenziei CBS 650.93 TaxID=1442369 RepID=A0A0D2J3W2_9EURO|nr:uncharacterized protein Z518_07233 [Rhinocladiella mackenziei CBS 650.93]KIX03680.1 hypothetical protein Z518_07233 [Rhinocladiella mackenziei CBS 650.93]